MAAGASAASCQRSLQLSRVSPHWPQTRRDDSGYMHVNIQSIDLGASRHPQTQGSCRPGGSGGKASAVLHGQGSRSEGIDGDEGAQRCRKQGAGEDASVWMDKQRGAMAAPVGRPRPVLSRECATRGTLSLESQSSSVGSFAGAGPGRSFPRLLRGAAWPLKYDPRTAGARSLGSPVVLLPKSTRTAHLVMVGFRTSWRGEWPPRQGVSWVEFLFFAGARKKEKSRNVKKEGGSGAPRQGFAKLDERGQTWRRRKVRQSPVPIPARAS